MSKTTIKTLLKRFLPEKWYQFVREEFLVLQGNWWKNHKLWGYLAPTSVVERPLSREGLRLTFLEKNACLRHSAKIISRPPYRFIMKKYSVCAPGITVVTGNHYPIVGLPFFASIATHIGDTDKDIVMEESAWCGANVTLLSGSRIGRGAIIGAGAVVNKPIPPYALAVGIPAKVVASVFTIDQILCHEALIYPPEERFTRVQLEKLFEEHFQGKRA